MHKDQKRVVDDILPLIEEATGSTDPQAIRDCTLLNRLICQGPDPIFIMETCPEQFATLCGYLNLPVAAGRDAIEKAHEQGPAVLLGEGIGITTEGLDVRDSVSVRENENRVFRFRQKFGDLIDWKREALWVLLASVSNCKEEGYEAESIQDRVTISVQVGIAFDRFLTGLGDDNTMIPDVVTPTVEAIKKFEASVTFTEDARYPDVPHGGEQDLAFYVGYRFGYSCVSVQSGSMTFYGTAPEHSLEEQGIKVDKEISPTFGICYR